MAQQFRVVISGRTLSGRPLEAVKAEAGRVFRLEGAQLEQMFSGQRVVVSRQASPEKADKLRARLHALDIEAYLEPLTPPAAPEPDAPAPAPAPAPGAVASDELFALIAPPVTEVAARPSVMPAAVGASVAAVVPELVPIVDPTAEMLCPKCGEGQPRRTLCRRCGTDMPRYQAAQDEAEKEARNAWSAEVMARRSAEPPGKNGREWQAALLGMGFSGRLGCLDYCAATLLSLLLWLLFTLLAATTGKMAFAWLGIFLSSIYYLRAVALRLHDTGRTGWLSLAALVPVLGAVMVIVLLFIWGDGDENEHGMPPASAGGARAFVSLALLFLVSGLTYRSISQSPEKALKFLAAVSVGQSKARAAADPAEDDEQPADSGPQATVRYASNNRIDIYLTADCSDCTRMRAWLDTNRLHYTLYAVDSDEQAAQRLHSIIAGSGYGDVQVQLPVLEVNGKVLPANPDVGLVHRQLRQAPAS